MNDQPAPIRTLIVDDSEDECLMLHAALRSVASIQLVGFVHDGMEAIAYLCGADQFRDREIFPFPDLVLLDFRMPRCDGMQVLAYLKRQPSRPRVILWSNTVDQLDVPLALRLGADLVCQKPAHMLELMQIINRLESMVFRKGLDPGQRRPSDPFCHR
jgi:CheY-like chemotaxis protein